MMQNTNQKPVQEQQIRIESRGQRANESAGLNIDEHVRIFDPNTKEVHLEKRA